MRDEQTKYLQLAAQLLGDDKIRLATMPTFDWQTSFETKGDVNRWLGSDFPGNVDAETEQRLSIAVCKLVPGMDAERWSKVDETGRIPWLEQAIECRDIPSVEKPSKGTPGRPKNSHEDDKRIYDEYGKGLEAGEWTGQANYVRKNHPDKTPAWFTKLKKRVENRKKN